MKPNKRNRFFCANSLQKKIMLIVFAAALVPTVIVGACFYYLIFNVTAWNIGIPEAVASLLMPAVRQVNLIIMILVPVSIILIWLWALLISNKIVGPHDRLLREISEIAKGQRSGHIHIRPGDAMGSLVKNINLLIDKTKK